MKQSAFPFSLNHTYNFDEFIESEANKYACMAINNWQDYWGVSPYTKILIIQGIKYSGKTFLAKKWAKDTKGFFIDINNDVTEKIIKEYSTFIIDDFDAGWNEEQLLHTLNLLIENKKYTLITCRSKPKIKLPDLASRIKSFNLIKILQPDDQMMKMLIFKLFSNYSVVITNDVINFLVKHLPRDFPTIIGSVKLINNFALENKRKITIPLIKSALNLKPL